mgnify:CR=1 FL=1
MTAVIDEVLDALLAAGKLTEWQAAAIRTIITEERSIVLMPRQYGRSAVMDLVTQPIPMATDRGAPR